MNFLQKFNDLDGTTPGELQRNYNLFLRDISHLPQNKLKTLIQQTIPNDLQSEMLHLSLLLHIGTCESLETVLFRGNRFLNKKLTNNLRFIKHISQLNPKEFCERICPEISYVTRIRIINKLPKVITDVEVGKAFFIAVKERYGIRVASRLLPTCHENFVMEIVNEYDLKLNGKELIYLHGKYPNFVYEYFTETRKLLKHVRFAQYLAINDTETLCKLAKYGLPRLGRKASSYFLKRYKTKILEKPDLYRHVLKPRIVNSVLNLEESIQFIANILAETIDDYYFSYEICRYLQAMPLKVRGTIMFAAFKNKFGLELGPKFYNQLLLQVITREERGIFKLKDEKYVDILPVEDAIPLIKEKIRLTSDIAARTNLIAKLVINCSHNRDTAALLDVLQYFSKHHRYDVAQLRYILLGTIKSYFKLHRLSAEHWKYINEILTILEINDDHYYLVPQIIECRILYKYLNGLDYTEDVPKLLKVRGIAEDWSVYIPNTRRTCTIKAAEYLEALELRKQPIAAHSFFDAVVTYNSKKKSDPIPILQYYKFLDVYFDHLETDRGKKSSSLKYIMKSIPRNCDENCLKLKIIKRYFEICPRHDRTTINLWFLKHEPPIVIDNAEAYFDKGKFELRNEFYYYASKSKSVARKFRELAMNIIDSENSQAKNVAIALKYLAFDNKFLDVAAKYRPNDNYEIDINDDNIRNAFAAQKAVLAAVRNVPVSKTCISEVLHYCKGDYLLYAIKALYTTMYNMPEKSIYGPIDVLMKGKLSVKEQSIYLLCNLSTSCSIKSALFELGSGDDVKTLGKFVFKCTFKGLADHQDDEFFELLVKYIDLLDKKDDESYNMMLELKYIPKKFQGPYLKIMWRHAEEHKLQFKLLNVLKGEIWSKLDNVFREIILKSTLFQPAYAYDLVQLVYEYLLDGGDLKTIYTNNNVNARNLYNLLRDIMGKIVNDSKRKKLSLQLLTKLLENLHHVPVTCDKYPIELMFESTKFLLEIEGDIITPMSHYMVQKQEIAVEKYGSEITAYFRDFALYFLRTAISSRDFVINSKNAEKKITISLFEAAGRIAECGDCTHIKLLALHVLPKRKAKDDDFIKRRKQVLDNILDNCNAAVNVYMAVIRYTEDV